ncbi:hypothetical protein OHB53_00830 [Streptomyces sp. NBC_00056]|uniref:hypothetical protein n=1 Tax=unclassified Streptomyces TaxID=2593676 RepID=UPI00324EAE55
MTYAFAVQSPGGGEWGVPRQNVRLVRQLAFRLLRRTGRPRARHVREAAGIQRWAYEPGAWAQTLERFGFTDVAARVAPAPQDQELGTLLVTGRR